MRSMVEGACLKLGGWGDPPPPRSAVPLPYGWGEGACGYPTAASFGGFGRPWAPATRSWNQATPASCFGERTPPR
jgi:hypothetical protein